MVDLDEAFEFRTRLMPTSWIEPVKFGWYTSGRNMPSALHEALVDLFEQRITLAPEIIRKVLQVDLPSFTEARVEKADFTQIVSTEYRADLVVLLRRGDADGGSPSTGSCWRSRDRYGANARRRKQS